MAKPVRKDLKRFARNASNISFRVSKIFYLKEKGKRRKEKGPLLTSPPGEEHSHLSTPSFAVSFLLYPFSFSDSALDFNVYAVRESDFNIAAFIDIGVSGCKNLNVWCVNCKIK